MCTFHHISGNPDEFIIPFHAYARTKRVKQKFVPELHFIKPPTFISLQKQQDDIKLLFGRLIKVEPLDCVTFPNHGNAFVSGKKSTVPLTRCTT